MYGSGITTHIQNIYCNIKRLLYKFDLTSNVSLKISIIRILRYNGKVKAIQ